MIISLHRSRYRRAFWRRLLPLTGDVEDAIKSRLARGRERLRSIYARRFGVVAAPTPSLIPGETR